MKKSKLLIPLLSISGAAAIVAPIMTSCSQGEKEETHFSLSEGEKEQTFESPTISGQLAFTFTATTEFNVDEAKLVEPVAVITSSNSYINIQRCWKESFENKTLKVIVGYTINPEAYEYKEEKGKKLPDEKLSFNMKIHNGTWMQTIDNFSITAKRADKQ